jgi:hypothetical protein
MIAVILVNVVLSGLVVVGIVGSLAYSIVASAQPRIRHRVVGHAASRLSPVPAAQRSMTRL